MSTRVPEGRVFFDGAWIAPSEAALPLTDAGAQSGIGVFETLAVRRGAPVDLEEHVARFDRSAEGMGFRVPRRDELAHAAAEAARSLPSGFGWLKFLATAGGHLLVFSGSMDPAEEGRAVSAVILPWRRHSRDPIAGIKTTSYAPFVRGTEWARARGADEGIWRNERGHLTEGCSTNLFVLSGRRVFTASPRDGILEGVTRGKVLEAARRSGFLVHEGKLRIERLRRADEAFVTSSARGVRPLLAVDGRAVGDGRPGPGTATIAGETSRLRGILPRD